MRVSPYPLSVLPSCCVVGSILRPCTARSRVEPTADLAQSRAITCEHHFYDFLCLPGRGFVTRLDFFWICDTPHIASENHLTILSCLSCGEHCTKNATLMVCLLLSTTCNCGCAPPDPRVGTWTLGDPCVNRSNSTCLTPCKLDDTTRHDNDAIKDRKNRRDWSEKGLQIPLFFLTMR